jgi:hypothetical protein
MRKKSQTKRVNTKSGYTIYQRTTINESGWKRLTKFSKKNPNKIKIR